MEAAPWLVGGLVVAAALISGCTRDAPDEEVAWRFEDLDGTTYTNMTVQGSPSLLFFMATWCGSCKASAPRLATLHEEFGPAGVQFFTLSWDPWEDAGDLASWKQSYDHPWPHGVDAENQVARHYGVTTQSSAVVLDADGRVVEKFGYRAGGLSEGDLRAALDEAVGRTSANTTAPPPDATR